MNPSEQDASTAVPQVVSDQLALAAARDATVHSSMQSSTNWNKIIIACAVAAIAGLLLYRFVLGGRQHHEPVEFMGETFDHVERVTPNEHVENNFYTVDGVAMPHADRWLQIVDLGAKVTNAQRDMVDQQIKTTMHVTPLEGYEDRLFGVVGQGAVYVLMLEASYFIYVESMGDGERDAFEARADEIVDAMMEIEH